MGDIIFTVEVMHIVSRNQRYAGFAGNGDKFFVDVLLGKRAFQRFGGNAVILQFKVKVGIPLFIRAEKIAVMQGLLLGLGGFPRPDQPRYLAGNAGGKGDKPVVVALQQFFINAGPVIKTLGVGKGAQFYQIEVTFAVCRQQYQVVVLILVFASFFFKTGIRRNIHLAPDYGVYRLFPLLAGGNKFHDSEHIAVIGQRQMAHPQLFRPVRQAMHRNGGILQ